MKKKIEKTAEEWKKQLSDEQFYVCFNKGTERPYTGEYYDKKDDGVYKCVACGNELFDSTTKFDSGTGWPSFFKPMTQESLDEESDHTLGMKRTEVTCSSCGAHLGHVFNDGPRPTGLRYCINSLSLKFEKRS